MALRLDLPEMPAAELVPLLADPHRAVHAYARLLALGPEATEAARAGLARDDERVREHCCRLLDHLMDADSIPLLIGALADPCERVRIAAVHALACDRCKTDGCRPAPEAVLPPAIDVLAGDRSALVRAYAAELVGSWVHSCWPHATRSPAPPHTTRPRRSGRRRRGTPRADPSTAAASRGPRRGSAAPRRCGPGVRCPHGSRSGADLGGGQGVPSASRAAGRPSGRASAAGSGTPRRHRRGRLRGARESGRRPGGMVASWPTIRRGEGCPRAGRTARGDHRISDQVAA